MRLLLARLALGLSGLFLLPILLIRAQPYDDRGLEAFLITDARCPSPCLLGIYPGETRYGEALNSLNAHQWVAQVANNRNLLGDDRPTIHWHWNGLQPGFLNPDGGGSVIFWDSRSVTAVLVELGLPLGELWMTLGPPDHYTVTSLNDGSIYAASYLAFRSFYRDPKIAVLGIVACPYHATLWETAVTLQVQPDQDLSPQMAVDDGPLPRRAAELQRQLC